jgi:hypothetical protein
MDEQAVRTEYLLEVTEMTHSSVLRTLLTCALALGIVGSATAAVTELEGSAGGGIVPWALLGGGLPTISTTWVNTGDYTLSVVAAQASFFDRIEISAGRMNFDTGAVGLGQIVVGAIGAKVQALKMSEHAPAVSVGAQYKFTNAPTSFLESVGADDASMDLYLAATKTYAVGSRKVLLNGTLRSTKANQLGILGFGSTDNDGYSAQFEGSAGLFLDDSTVIGVEYRTKPDNISGLGEDDWADLFFAFFPSKSLAIVAAYAELGDIASEANAGNGGNAGNNQRGLYLQVQANF